MEAKPRARPGAPALSRGARGPSPRTSCDAPHSRQALVRLSAGGEGVTLPKCVRGPRAWCVRTAWRRIICSPAHFVSAIHGVEVIMPSPVSTVHDTQSVQELRRELAEAREQQAATAQILRVLSGAPRDLRRVFSNIAASAARLCDANDAAIGQVDGNNLHLVAHHGPIPETAVAPLRRGALPARAALDRQIIHIPDLNPPPSHVPSGGH